MAKDAYWFKHDSNASRDLRMMQLRATHGYEGVGVFWAVIEVLREQHFYRWSENDIKILAKVIDFDQENLQSILEYCKTIGLLVFDSGFITSKRLKKDMKVWESKKGNRTKVERNENEPKSKRQDKSIEEKNREEKNISDRFPFQGFWDLYDKKRGRPKSESLWLKLSDADREAAMAYIPAYKLQFETQYRKDPERFLKYRCWEDELNNSPKNETKRVVSTEPNEW